LEWPVLAENNRLTAELDRLLRSSPAWNGRCWLAGSGVQRGEYVRVAILTGLEWPVLAALDRAESKFKAVVAILTGLEWPVLAPPYDWLTVSELKLRSSPAWNGRCWQTGDRLPHQAIKLRSSPAWISKLRRNLACCDPHRLGMAGAGSAVACSDL